jgi:hypothetical protein
MIVVMKRIVSRVEQWRKLTLLRNPRSTAAGTGERSAMAGALARRKGSFVKDNRGAVAFETIIVYVFMVAFLLLPLADVATAGFQYISAWAALRSFGQYLQYNPPPDVTSTSAWVAALRTTVGKYTISNIQVLCGDTGAGAACTSANDMPTKYYSYTTTFTLSPISIVVSKPILCPTSCTYTLTSTERFQ